MLRPLPGSFLRIIDMDARGQEHSGRSCGPCSACCTTHEIPEIAKPAGSTCVHVCESGCSIYDRRPGACAGYQCLWLAGTFRQIDARPDTLGLVFDMCEDSPLPGTILQAFEVRPNAAREPKAAYTLRKLSEVVGVILIPSGGGTRRITGPLPVRQAAARWIAQHKGS